MRLDLIGGELDQVESMWGQTWWGRSRHGAKPAATLLNTTAIKLIENVAIIHTQTVTYLPQLL